MVLYRVEMQQLSWEESHIEIEADTPEQAQELAREAALNGNVEWHYLESQGEIEAVSVDVIVK